MLVNVTDARAETKAIVPAKVNSLARVRRAAKSPVFCWIFAAL